MKADFQNIAISSKKRPLLAILLILIFLPIGCSSDFSISRYPKRNKIYRVHKGDTLSSISRKTGVSVATLKHSNHLTSSRIEIGQRLRVPKRSHRASSSTRHHKRHKKSSSSRWKKKRSKKRYRAPTGKAPKIKVRLSWPIRKPTITSRFGTRKSGKHDGVDIGVPKGTKIYAAAAGTVLFSGWGPTGYGKVVVIKHNAKVFTVYSHNTSNKVKKGRHVKRGEVIATVGRTGRATGPHLHFEVRVNRTAYNPLAYLPRLR